MTSFSRPVYISSLGSFLPGEGICNNQMEKYLGMINGKPSQQRKRVLERNGIFKRYYALDENGHRRYANYELAAQAIQAALENSNVTAEEIEYLAAATTLSDTLVPGFASLVHSASGIPMCDIASFSGVCASGVASLKSAYCQVASGTADNAISCASEFASRHLQASTLESSGLVDAQGRLPFDAEFLRWMLSDGAGAALLTNQPARRGLSFHIEWIDVRSHAHSHDICMYAGASKNTNGEIDRLWGDYADYGKAAAEGMFALRQDMNALSEIVPLGVAHYLQLVESNKIPQSPDHFICHYSAQHFQEKIVKELARFGAEIPQERWFSTIAEIGNTGSASIYIMLQQLMGSGETTARSEYFSYGTRKRSVYH